MIGHLCTVRVLLLLQGFAHSHQLVFKQDHIRVPGDLELNFAHFLEWGGCVYCSVLPFVEAGKDIALRKADLHDAVESSVQDRTGNIIIVWVGACFFGFDCLIIN